MSRKLTKGKLLEELQNMYHWSRSGFLEDKIGLNGLKQAHSQLKEIVGKWFEYGLDRGEVRYIQFQDGYAKLAPRPTPDVEVAE